MPIFHDSKTIFIWIPKNAGTSIVSTFRDVNKQFSGHHKYSFYQDKFPREFEQYKKIAVTRHPLDRFLSNYRYSKMVNSYWHSTGKKTSKFDTHPDYKLMKDKNINECIDLLSRKKLKHHGWETQSQYIYDHNDQLMVDELTKIEDLNKYPKINVSKQTNMKDNYFSSRGIPIYRAYLTLENISLLEKIYNRDINLLGYNI